MTEAWNPPTPTPTAQGVEELPEILSPDQAAWLLQLTPAQLKAASDRGDLPTRWLSPRKRIYSKAGLIDTVRRGTTRRAT